MFKLCNLGVISTVGTRKCLEKAKLQHSGKNIETKKGTEALILKKRNLSHLSLRSEIVRFERLRKTTIASNVEMKTS